MNNEDPPPTPPGFIKYYSTQSLVSISTPEDSSEEEELLVIDPNELYTFINLPNFKSIQSSNMELKASQPLGTLETKNLEQHINLGGRIANFKLGPALKSHFLKEKRMREEGFKKSPLRQLKFYGAIFLTLSSLFLLLVTLATLDFSSDEDMSERIKTDSRWKRSEKLEGFSEDMRRTKKLPQAIIIGARKCGTRALIDMLNLHPQVEKAALEVHFFDRDENYGQGLDWYRNQMPETGEGEICIEKSPSYFVTPGVAERVREMSAEIKLILIVREPVTRVISDYTQIYGTNSKTQNSSSKVPSLEQLLFHSDGLVNVQYKAVRISMYARYLEHWLSIFPLSRIHIVDGDALIRDPYPVVKEVEKYLSLPPVLSPDNFYFNLTKGFYCWRKLVADKSEKMSGRNITGEKLGQNGLHCLNESKGRQHQVVNTKIVKKLREFYTPHNMRFYNMIKRDMGWPEK